MPAARGEETSDGAWPRRLNSSCVIESVVGVGDGCATGNGAGDCAGDGDAETGRVDVAARG